MMSLNQTNFREFIKSSTKPAVVKFHADWCKDCRAIKKAAAELATEYEASLAFGELDTVIAPEIRDAYQVRGIPTFIAFRNGREIARAPTAGSTQKELRSRTELERFLASLLN